MAKNWYERKVTVPVWDCTKMGMILDQYHVTEYRGLKRKISRDSGSCLALCKPLVSHRFTPPILNQRVKNPELFNGYSGGTVYALLMGHIMSADTSAECSSKGIHL